MAEKIVLHDFVELDYTGKFKDGTVFDTTSKETAEDNNIFSAEMKYKPAVVCVGEKQLIPGLDGALLGKEVGKSFTVELEAEEAFGKKDFKKIRLVPIAEFQKRKVNPTPGLQLDMDGEVGVVIRASGGRIMVNFNHPFAGREVVYEVKVKRKITDKKEKLDSFMELSFNLPGLKTEVEEGKAKVTLPLELPPEVAEELGKKLKGIVGLKEVSFEKGEGKKEEVEKEEVKKEEIKKEEIKKEEAGGEVEEREVKGGEETKKKEELEKEEVKEEGKK